MCRWIFFKETTVEPRLFQTCLKYPYIWNWVVVISECFISECSGIFFFLYFNLWDTPSFAIFKAEIPIFHPPQVIHTHTHFPTLCSTAVYTFQFKYQVHTCHRVAPRLLMKVKSRFKLRYYVGETSGMVGGVCGMEGGRCQENWLILVRSSDRCCIPLKMKMNKYLHQFSLAVMLCSNQMHMSRVK